MAVRTEQKNRNDAQVMRLPKRRKRPNWGLTTLAAPGILVLLLISYVPMFGMVIPFKKIDYAKGIWGSDWIQPWYKNFEFFFNSNSVWKLTWNTIKWNLVLTILCMLIAVALALLLYDLKARQVKIYQTCIFVPYFISWVVASYIVYAFLANGTGLIPNLLKTLGLDVPKFYLESKYWKIIIPICKVWKSVGHSTLLYYAVLLGMDASIFEAAALDGATRWQRIRYIMLPYLKPTMAMLLLLAVGGMFSSDMGMFYMLPNNSGMLYEVTDVIDTYVYRAMRITGDISMSAAVGLFQSVAGFIAVLLTNLVARKLDSDSALF